MVMNDFRFHAAAGKLPVSEPAPPLRIQFGIDHPSDQNHHLIHARGIMLKYLPDQRFAFDQPSGLNQGLRIQVAEFE